MHKEVSVHITDAYRQGFLGLAFGIETIPSCTYFEKSESFKLFKRELLRKMRRKTNLALLEERINLSRDIAVYVFTAPGIQEEQVSNGLQLALEILEKFGYGKDSWSQIYKP